MMKKLLSTAAALLVSGFILSGCSTTEKHWGYTGDVSPEHWGGLSDKFKTCAVGQKQSPVNIQVQKATDKDLPALNINYLASKATVVNNGHSIQTDLTDENSTLTINGKVYTLKQFHFHSSSENTIDGQYLPLEGHFVHVAKDGGIVVVAVLYEIGGENAQLADIWAGMPEKAGEKVKLKAKFNPATLISSKQSYYSFEGSLTTPPCTEGVDWIVLKAYGHVSAEQVEKFAKAVGVKNNRPVQPLNERTIAK
ncbi:carbonic anhydrase [Basfia succiniciproducens]|uniref:carbonic anhydrase n=1 Tax=Basfia succiniciproducens TaxID=653940 RepID=UPI0008C708BB|nr:carbonic anhydrase family protein [Basfia succiniciproducens]SEQ45397.1 carbonic anhydrase [Basfia succiniciproducens]